MDEISNRIWNIAAQSVASQVPIVMGNNQIQAQKKKLFIKKPTICGYW